MNVVFVNCAHYVNFEYVLRDVSPCDHVRLLLLKFDCFVYIFSDVNHATMPFIAVVIVKLGIGIKMDMGQSANIITSIQMIND